MKMIWLHYCDGSAELVEHDGDRYHELIDAGWSESRAEAKKLANELQKHDFDNMDDEELVAAAKEAGIKRAATMKRETIIKKLKGE